MCNMKLLSITYENNPKPNQFTGVMRIFLSWVVFKLELQLTFLLFFLFCLVWFGFQDAVACVWQI